ncbi:3-oxoacyl-ACP synthase [Bizionia gelidisalsuginis]|uniref:3-oxoacyl-ACP synthase n=2 Tax=Bizionia TaxID=283785 RepID=A0A8H2QF41_9FLAO|nr:MULTISPECIES: 3-oxoacyl-ACP synthase [Bizionia]TYB74127.1 3-oxoacyl-ACP synthase [Bizionia saleffrena]TYC15575.1 3-oxoacyl-ACP synthase [Bizionia gelidisalsuginis]
MNQNKESKQALYNLCAAFIEAKRQTIQHTIFEIQQSLTSETKSSAGDKHETGRAMLQIEREKAGQQLAEIQKLQEHLSKMDSKIIGATIRLGSMVITTNVNYYIAISAGRLEWNNTVFYAISPSTPMGQLLMGKTVGDSIVFRDIKSTIIQVL